MDINNNLFRNWIVSASGFHFVKCGLDDFVSNGLVAHHRRLKTHVSQQYPNATPTQCTRCTLDNLFPNHGGAGRCNHRYKNDCIERKKSKKGRRLCPNKFCGYFYHLIVNDHVENTPRWTCTDMARWSVDWFEYAKCFLGNHTDAKSFNELDCTGVLSIIIQNRHMLNKVDNIDAFKKCRENRNIIFHTANYEVSDQDCARYIDTMIAVLGDKKCLKDNDKAKHMVIRLEQLRKESISIIKGTDINELIEESQKAVDALVAQRSLAKCEMKQLIKQVNEVKDKAVGAISNAVNTIVEKHAKISKLIMENINIKEDFTTPQEFQVDTSTDGPNEEAVTKAAKILLQTMEAAQTKKKPCTQIEKTMQELVDKFAQYNAVITHSEQHEKVVRTTFRCPTLADMLGCIQYLNSEECMTLLKQSAKAVSDKIGQAIELKRQAVEASVKKAIDTAVPKKVIVEEHETADKDEPVKRNMDGTKPKNVGDNKERNETVDEHVTRKVNDTILTKVEDGEVNKTAVKDEPVKRNVDDTKPKNVEDDKERNETVDEHVTRKVNDTILTKVKDNDEIKTADKDELVKSNVADTIPQKKLRDIYLTNCKMIPQLFKYRSEEARVKLRILQDQESLLEKVSTLAFDHLFKDHNFGERNVFTWQKLMTEPYSFSEDEIALLHNSGILVDVMYPEDQVQRLKFANALFLEFFASNSVLTLKSSEYSDMFTKLTTLDNVKQFETFFRFFATIATERQIENLFGQISQAVTDLFLSCMSDVLFPDTVGGYMSHVLDLQTIAIACIQGCSTVHRKVNIQLEHFVFDIGSNDKLLAAILLMNKTRVKYIFCRGVYHNELDQISGLQCLHVKYSPYEVVLGTRFNNCLLRNKASLHTLFIEGSRDNVIKSNLLLRIVSCLTSLSLRDIDLEHSSYQMLLTYLSNNALLQNLQLINIQCITHTEDKGSCVKTLTLSQITASKLTSLCIIGSAFEVSKVDPSDLKSLTLSPISMKLYRCYTNFLNCIISSNLVDLYVSGRCGEESDIDTSTLEALTSVVSTLSCLRSIKIRNWTFSDEFVLRLHCDVSDVTIHFDDVEMSRNSFESFIEHVVSIKSSVQVQLQMCVITEGSRQMSDSKQLKYLSDILKLPTLTITNKESRLFVFETAGNHSLDLRITRGDTYMYR